VADREPADPLHEPKREHIPRRGERSVPLPTTGQNLSQEPFIVSARSADAAVIEAKRIMEFGIYTARRGDLLERARKIRP
jgi:hypothetical protein